MTTGLAGDDTGTGFPFVDNCRRHLYMSQLEFHFLKWVAVEGALLIRHVTDSSSACTVKLTFNTHHNSTSTNCACVCLLRSETINPVAGSQFCFLVTERNDCTQTTNRCCRMHLTKLKLYTSKLAERFKDVPDDLLHVAILVNSWSTSRVNGQSLTRTPHQAPWTDLHTPPCHAHR